MADVAWKCFRCNLTFKDEKVASNSAGGGI